MTLDRGILSTLLNFPHFFGLPNEETKFFLSSEKRMGCQRSVNYITRAALLRRRSLLSNHLFDQHAEIMHHKS